MAHPNRECKHAVASFTLILVVECGLRYLVTDGLSAFNVSAWFRMLFWAVAGALGVYLMVRKVSVSGKN
jgi:hypothetical protein